MLKKLYLIKKIVDLNAKMFAKKIIVTLVFKIDGNSIYIKNILSKQNITVLLQIFIQRSEI